jgi:hypothetical protein
LFFLLLTPWSHKKNKKMDLLTFVPLPVRPPPGVCNRDALGRLSGRGVAVCPDLGLLVISSYNKLQVFVLPEDIARGEVGSPRELAPTRTLGGVAPMEFHFDSRPDSGLMAFTDGCGVSLTSLLLVTDAGNEAVHVIDVVHGVHMGYVAAPGTILHPRGVATRKSLAAVTCWETGCGHVVRVFEGSGATWTAVRGIAGGFFWPCGLRFTADGLRLLVADSYNQRLSIFCARDGPLLRHIDLGVNVNVMDVEECGSGWVMCHSRGLVAVADNANAEETGIGARSKNLDSHYYPLALATVPGLGLVVRHETGVQFLATPDVVAMAAMSFCKVAWMAAVCRGTILRRATIWVSTKKHCFS